MILKITFIGAILQSKVLYSLARDRTLYQSDKTTSKEALAGEITYIVFRTNFDHKLSGLKSASDEIARKCLNTSQYTVVMISDEGWCHEGDALNELPMTEDKPDLSVSIRAKNIRLL